MKRNTALKHAIKFGSLAALCWATSGSSGCGCGPQNITVTPETPVSGDAVWCDVTAVQCYGTGLACINPGTGATCPETAAGCEPPCGVMPGACNQVPCTAPGGASCNSNFSSCTTCNPTPVSPPDIDGGLGGGFLQCFNHTKSSAQHACTSLCNGTSNNPDGLSTPPPPYFDPRQVPLNPNLLAFCNATVDTASHQAGSTNAYNASDLSDGGLDYRMHGCVDPGVANPVNPAGTNVAELGGSGTFMSPGNGVTPQTATLEAGYIDITAPSATCNPLTAFCNAGVNAMYLDFKDFNVVVSGTTHTVNGLDLQLDFPFLSAPGEVVPGNAAFPDPEYMFTIPQGVTFDSIGTVDGTLEGVTAVGDTGTTGMIDLVTGEVSFDFELSDPVNGFPVTLTGSTFTTQLVDVAPVVSAPATVTVDATTSCSASVTLAPTATSLVGLPVTFLFSVDDQFVSSGTTATVTEPIGTHTVSIVGVDTLGEQGSATETVTINDETAPAFSNVPGPETVQGCTNSGSGPVPVAAPTAQDVCSGAAATVSGSVIQFNGAATSIPVVNGTVSVPSGSGTLQFVATNANGVTSTVDVPLTVLAPPTFYGTQGVTVDDGDTSDGVNGTIYSGAGGQILLQDDAQVGSIFSLSPVVLQDRVVSPSIDTNAGITFGHSDVIASTSTATPTLPAFPTAPVTFTGTTAITVNPSTEKGDVVTLAPGQYGAVTVYSRGQLILSAGNYEFSSLDLEPQGQLVVPSATSETAHVFVENTVIYRGSTNVATTSSSPPPAPLFLVYTGTATLTIGSPFTGTILAPNAPLSLQSLNGQGVYTGEFFAQQITLSPHTTVNSNPFTCIP